MKHCIRQNFCFWMKCLEKICFYLTRPWNHVSVIVKMNAFRMHGSRTIWVLLKTEKDFCRRKELSDTEKDFDMVCLCFITCVQ